MHRKNKKTNATPHITIEQGWRILATACAILLLVGHSLPWAAHTTAALTLSANDLAFFTNFTPGAGIFLNEWFYVPVWVAAVLLAAVGHGLSRPNRTLLAVFAWGVASLGLPRYEQLIKFIRTPLPALRESDFVLQLVLTLGVMALVLWLVLKPSQYFKPGMRSMAGFALVAVLCLVPLVGYIAIQPFIADLYGDSYRSALSIGYGWRMTFVADLLLWAMTFATILNARSAHRTPTNQHQAH